MFETFRKKCLTNIKHACGKSIPIFVIHSLNRNILKTMLCMYSNLSDTKYHENYPFMQKTLRHFVSVKVFVSIHPAERVNFLNQINNAELVQKTISSALEILEDVSVKMLVKSKTIHVGDKISSGNLRADSSVKFLHANCNEQARGLCNLYSENEEKVATIINNNYFLNKWIYS
ncbi:UNVERIFIED_CONTAM: hypothetical protein NCL1_23112 [Trichonephila clavipes]